MERRRELTGLYEGDKCWAKRNQKETELVAVDRVEWRKLIRRREVGVSRELQLDLGNNRMERKRKERNKIEKRNLEVGNKLGPN